MTPAQAFKIKPGTVLWAVTDFSNNKPGRVRTVVVGATVDAPKSAYDGPCMARGKVMTNARGFETSELFLSERAAAQRLYNLNEAEGRRLAKSHARAAAHDRKVLAKQRARTRDLKRRLATL